MYLQTKIEDIFIQQNSWEENKRILQELKTKCIKRFLLNWVLYQINHKLPEQQRMCVLMRYLQEMPYSQIAIAINKDTSTAYRNTRQGIANIRMLAIELYKEEEELFHDIS